MFNAKQMNKTGIPAHRDIMSLALKTVNKALAAGADEAAMRARLAKLANDPRAMLDDQVLGALAQKILEIFPQGTAFSPRAEPAPWQKWCGADTEAAAIEQMRQAASLPIARRGALMPDAHSGYGLPIGGVLGVKNAVIPYAVGKDIACRMHLTVLDLPVSSLREDRERLTQAIERETRFGMGAGFEAHERREHQVLEEDWGITPVTRRMHERAWKQLGSSGMGNHFVEFGELRLDRDDLGLSAGVYAALLSHSGSRGTGEEVATYYSELAQRLKPWLPEELKTLAWLDLDTAEGQEYWHAMQLMGRYAAANHELIHGHIMANLGASALASVDNHHNFAWKEAHDGEEMIVHRKGATPAGRGLLGIIPGSMGTPGFVVRGKGNAASLNTCSHGAGRKMSRGMAFRTLNRDDWHKFLQDAGIELISGSLDEAPAAYKDIHEVMAAQTDLVDVVARFEPRLVKMADAPARGQFARKDACV